MSTIVNIRADAFIYCSFWFEDLCDISLEQAFMKYWLPKVGSSTPAREEQIGHREDWSTSRRPACAL
jgi:hypothetical protein